MVRLHIVILNVSLLLCCFSFPVNSEQGRRAYSNRLESGKSLSCFPTVNATISFKNNLDLLLSDFTLQSSQTSFYNASKGNAPNQVYGYYLCRGDITRKLCSNCLLNGMTFARSVSCNHVDGTYSSEKCMFRYSNHSMYGMWERPSSSSFDYVETNVSNYQQFNQTLSSTIEAVIDEAASKRDNSDGSMPGFATKEAKVTAEETIYTMAQCPPDIVGKNCSQCLRSAFSDLKRFAHGSPGAISYMDKCQLRYDNISFYDLEGHKHSNGEPLRIPNLLYSAVFLFIYSSFYLVLF